MSELKHYKMVDEKYCTDCVCVIPSEVYLKPEADKVIAVDEYNRLRDENAELREKVATLEEAQRWRSVSEEKPKDGELVFVRFAERGCGHYFPMDVVRWNSSYRLGEIVVTHWMPMPEEPKENDDARKD